VLGIFSILILNSVKRNTNNLKFTYLWLIFILLSFIPLVLPRQIQNILEELGFENSSDGLLVLSIIYTSLILFYATICISRTEKKIEELSIQIALRTIKK
jgi:hypothetical protein